MVLPRVVVPALMIAALATGPITQAQVAAPAFEVASIRPNTSGSDERSGGAMPGGRFLATNVTLEILILEAYRIPSSRLVEDPAG